MSSEWSYVPLSELTTTPVTYGVVQPGSNVSDGVPLIRVNNFRGGALNLEEVSRISRDIETKYQRTRVTKGDVLLTIVGSVGQVAIVPPALEGWNIARAVAMIRPKSPDMSRWISLVLRSPVAQHQLGMAANTTVQTTINLKDLRQLQVPIPEKRIRDEICKILGALDDRIDNLRQTNATLEAITQALFKSWFVDFDPVRAKTEGREPEGMDAATAALFPSEFDSALGPIPKGWNARPLDSLADYRNGLALQRHPPESEDEYLPVIKIAQLRAGHTEGADRASAQLRPEYVVSDGDVLFSWSGSLEVEIWFGGRGALNQHLFKVTSREAPKWFYYFATRHHLPMFREVAANKATTMGHIQRRHLKEALIAVPPAAVLSRFSETMSPLLDLLITNGLRARTLSALRDALLPRLVSGKLRLY